MTLFIIWDLDLFLTNINFHYTKFDVASFVTYKIFIKSYPSTYLYYFPIIKLQVDNKINCPGYMWDNLHKYNINIYVLYSNFT